MRFFRVLRERHHMPLFAFFAIGMVIGLFSMGICRTILLEKTGFLDEQLLYQMKYMSVDSGLFFFYVCRKRLGMVVVILLLASTYLGIAVVYSYAGWLGASLGMFLAAAVIRYGFKGILLVLVAMFPHYLMYVPAWVLLFSSARRLCASMYFPGKNGAFPIGGRKEEMKFIFLTFLKVSGVVIIGIWLESYVNPRLIAGLLKIF